LSTFFKDKGGRIVSTAQSYNKVIITDDISNYELENKWVSLLINYGSKEEFIKIYRENISIPLAIMSYRKQLKNKGIGDISYITLEQAYTKQHYNKLHKLLQELFLEYIPEEHFNFILEKLKQKENSLHILYEEYLKDKNKRILNIVLTL